MSGSTKFFKTLIILLFLGLVACSDDDDKKPAEQGDVVEEQDATGGDDAAGPGDDANAPDDDVAPPEDDVVQPDACAPGSDARKQAARAQVAENEGVNAGAATFTVEDGVHFATLDAVSGGPPAAATTSYIYVDLDTAEKLEISDVEAFENADWDIAVRRAMIRINSGDSGPGVWMVAQVDEKFEDALPPDATDRTAWKSETFIGPDCSLLTDGEEPFEFMATAFGEWYEYDFATHTPKLPEKATWFLYNRTDHRVYKFGIDSFDGSIYEIRWTLFGAED